MSRTHQHAYQLTTGSCARCGKDGIPEDQLFLAVDRQWPNGWLTVCEDCDDGDGSIRYHGKTIIEFRALTAFGSGEFHWFAVDHPLYPAVG